MQLIDEIRACTLCREQLPLPPKPILQGASNSKILIAGQAPGRKAHDKGIPFDDPSGNRLRDWLGVSRSEFYDETLFAIVPMGFCFPGTNTGSGAGGDLPPLPRCAETWRQRLLAGFDQVALTLVIGQYALNWHLPGQGTVTEQVKNQSSLANVIALPHPSPRNNRWLKQNPWFEKAVLPVLKDRVAQILN